MGKGVFASPAVQVERDEALIRERLEIYRAIIAGNLAGGFTQMPDQVREDPTLSRAAKLVYEQLLRYTRQDKNFCWPSQQRIADDLVTISRRTVIRAITELYERGYLEKWRRGLNRTNIYYINPLSFPGSFKRAWRGRGVLLEAHGPEVRSSVEELPPVDVLAGVSGKCQNDTSSNAKMTLQDAPIWHTKHTKSKNKQSETDSEESKIRRGADRADLEKGTDGPNPVPAYSHIAHQTIGNPNEEQLSNPREVPTNEQQTNKGNAIEDSNPSKEKEPGRPARVKEVEDDKKGRKARTFEEMAALVGIAPETLDALKAWVKACPRPEVTPLKLQGVIPMWSRELGNAEPQLIAANLTQASKLYKYARLQGLSQEAAEGCFEHAREAVRNHPEVTKKMAFFFTSLKLDILVALKQQQGLPATRSLSTSSIPDGYEEDLPAAEEATNPFPPEAALSAEVESSEVCLSVSEPKPEEPPVALIRLSLEDHPEWKTWDTANWWGERLRDELDPMRQFSRYEVRPTEQGCYGFVFFLREQADPIWKELLAGNYVTKAAVKQALEAIRTVRGPQERRRGRR